MDRDRDRWELTTTGIRLIALYNFCGDHFLLLSLYHPSYTHTHTHVQMCAHGTHMSQCVVLAYAATQQTHSSQSLSLSLSSVLCVYVCVLIQIAWLIPLQFLSLCLSGLKLIGSFFKWQGTPIYKWHPNSGVCLRKGHTTQILFSFMKLNLIIVQLFCSLCPVKD